MIDEQKFVQAVRSIANDNPTHVYEKPAGQDTCLYQYSGSPSCLIGHALFQMGVSIKQLEGFDSAENIPDASAYEVLKHLGASEYVAEWADAVQGAQDTLTQWGAAVEYADETMEDTE